jgi:hypothetical protein
MRQRDQGQEHVVVVERRGSLGRRARSIRSFASVALIASLTSLAARAHAETLSSHFLRIDPEPTVDEKTGTPVIPMLIEVGAQIPITDFSDGCFTGGTGAKVNKEALECMSAKIERDGYEKQREFPEKNAHIVSIVEGSPQPMEIVSSVAFKDATAPNAGVAWLIIMDASSSVGARWDEMRDVATHLIKSMGPQDAVKVRIMDDHDTREQTPWLSDAKKGAALALIAKINETYKNGGPVDALIARIEKETVGSFQSLLKDGVQDTDAIPLMQSLVILSDGGDTTGNSFAGGQTAQLIHQKLVKGELDVADNLRMPIPVVSIWFPVNTWGGLGGLEDQKRNNEYQWMSNIATPEVGGYFDIVMDGDTGKGARIAKKVRERFNHFAYVEAKATCLDISGDQTFKLAFEGTKSRILPDSWSKIGIAYNFTKWLLYVDKQKTEEVARKKPLQPGETFDVYGEFCWGANTGAAEAYFVTEADAPDVKKAASDRTGKKAKELLTSLAAKGQKAETISVSPLTAKFRVPTTAALFDNKPESFALNVVLLDNKALRVSANDKSGLLVLKAQKAPLPKALIVGAVGGGVVLILLVAILARGGGSGGGSTNARKKSRRGGTPPTPGPTPGQPPPAPPFGASPINAPPNTAPAPFAASLPKTAPPPQQPAIWSPAVVPPTAPSPYGQAPIPVPIPIAHAGAQPVAIQYAHVPTAPPIASGTSFPTPCPNPACGKSVMIPPGGSAQCAFCGSLVDARGQLIGEVPAQGAFGLTGNANEQSAARAVATAGPVTPSTLALQGPSGRVLSGAILQGQVGTYRVLPGIECRVGRDGTQCSIALQETRVSSVHATLKVEGPTLLVRDDRSHNGTFVNGNRIAGGSWVPVAGGSQLRFGPVEFVVQYEA